MQVLRLAPHDLKVQPNCFRKFALARVSVLLPSVRMLDSWKKPSLCLSTAYYCDLYSQQLHLYSHHVHDTNMSDRNPAYVTATLLRRVYRPLIKWLRVTSYDIYKNCCTCLHRPCSRHFIQQNKVRHGDSLFQFVVHYFTGSRKESF